MPDGDPDFHNDDDPEEYNPNVQGQATGGSWSPEQEGVARKVGTDLLEEGGVGSCMGVVELYLKYQKEN
ncbi:hypothetical protein E2C01_057635 [Portunus trituberculatus]|uniref:Uncharacterized protein n=1 Tax=Portunus trituberculatus TaxID=210409 RepID=A0A5B7H2H7_PORTR|nr:hypothetical protein [Portunus trituberculatus]